jgi:hypothetical protein
MRVQDGSTALHCAARDGETELAVALVRAKADMTIPDQVSPAPPLLCAGGSSRGTRSDAHGAWGDGCVGRLGLISPPSFSLLPVTLAASSIKSLVIGLVTPLESGSGCMFASFNATHIGRQSYVRVAHRAALFTMIAHTQR